MQDKVNRITSLIEKFLEERLTVEEDRELKAWLAEAEHNDSFFQQLTDKNVLREKLKLYANADSESMWKKTLQKIDGGAKLIDLYPEKKAVKIPFGKIAIAASVLLLITAGTYYFVQPSANKQTAQKDTHNHIEKLPIVPGGIKATLTLGNGSNIELNTVPNGNLANEGMMQVTKTDGQLFYNKKANTGTVAEKEVVYNTITTPRGGEFQVTLPDGSKVWLNAASSLRFPIVFAGNERIVELTGEAYFEVNTFHQQGAAPEDKAGKLPFIVKINTAGSNRNEVEVLGTHFNVMAYKEEDAIKTTLLEGKVKVTSGNSIQTIKPGEQAKLKEGNISIHKVDADEITSWMNGFIPVGGYDIDYTLRQISRWYDVNIKYEGKKPEGAFEGKLPRAISIENVIKLLNANNIKARLNEKEREIIVTS